MTNLTPENSYIFRITHRDNVRWILNNGLHCRNSNVQDPNFIQIGNAGLTEGVTGETERALHDHELIKVRARVADRAARDALFSELTQRTHSELVDRIGHVAVLYRPRKEGPKLLIPDY